MEKNYTPPPIVWLKMTDYMHGWLQHELSGAVSVGGQHVICVQHLPGARDVLRMETMEDMMEPRKVQNAMSSTRRNCVAAGLELEPQVVERLYGMTEKTLQTFVPVECPRMCMTRNGVLRPWTLDTCLGKEQASALQRLLKQAFWDAVKRFDVEYASESDGEPYPAVEMIEAFCSATRTPDLYVDAMRREWQRREKRQAAATA